MRKIRFIDEENLMPLIRVLTENGKRIEVHKTTGFKGYNFCQYYELFILEDKEEDR